MSALHICVTKLQCSDVRRINSSNRIDCLLLKNYLIFLNTYRRSTINFVIKKLFLFLKVVSSCRLLRDIVTVDLWLRFWRLTRKLMT